MKKRMTILFLVFVVLLVSMGCGPGWERLFHKKPKRHRMKSNNIFAYKTYINSDSKLF